MPSHATGAVTVTATFGSLSDTYDSFTYNTDGVPTITSISPASGSPVIKQDLTITGTNFGTDRTAVKVYLNDATSGEMAYELYVTTCTDTEITATLSGGHSGAYKVVVWKSSIGNSIGDIDFSYEITITAISP